MGMEIAETQKRWEILQYSAASTEKDDIYLSRCPATSLFILLKNEQKSRKDEKGGKFSGPWSARRKLTEQNIAKRSKGRGSYSCHACPLAKSVPTVKPEMAWTNPGPTLNMIVTDLDQDNAFQVAYYKNDPCVYGDGHSFIEDGQVITGDEAKLRLCVPVYENEENRNCKCILPFFMAAAARYPIDSPHRYYPLLPLLVLVNSSVSAAAARDEGSPPGCRPSCGDVSITYPFGIGTGCHLPGFEIVCERGIPFLAGTEIQLLEILPGEVRVNSTPFVVSYCPRSSKEESASKTIVLPKHGPFSFLTGSNKLVVLGCNVQGTVIYGPGSSASFCFSGCPSSPSDVISQGTCDGHGCCEHTIEEVTDSLEVVVEKFENQGFYSASMDCSYAFIVDDGQYNYSQFDRFSKDVSNISMKLEWAIGEGTCGQALGTSSYACGTNSACLESHRSSGYLCACRLWDVGNPYLNGTQGCQDPMRSPFSNCRETCGNLTVRYPFGIGEGCSRRGFEVTCRDSGPYLTDLNLQLHEIGQGEVTVNATSFLVMDCPGTPEMSQNSTAVELPQDSPYTISVGSNKFTVLGCDGEGTIADDNSLIKTCRSRCSNRGSNAANGVCNGDGCCESSLPLLRKSFELTVSHAKSTYSDTCSYAFVAEDGSYEFKEEDLIDFRRTADLKMKLEWAIGDATCKEAMSTPLYTCGRNTTCLESPRGYGYLCSCLDGLQGNPYSPQGCQDIEECGMKILCAPGDVCRNPPGGHRCRHPTKITKGKLRKVSSVAQVIAASITVAAIMVACISWCYWVYRKREDAKLRANHFLRNGGLLLRQHLSPRRGLTTNHPKKFSAEELKVATENYKSGRVLGHGSHGTVYRGILKDRTVVAVKKSQVVAQDKLNQFINELVILTQINHRNIVKLLGCCLETQVPLLVYEYIPNGTLHQNLHRGPDFPRLPWKDRLRIATEVAEALSYLHSYASMPIIHRDVKSSNILLDQTSTAKLADFGISRLVPIDKEQVSTAVLGTFGYLDPAYFNSGKLTEKSDVYSYGVVLLELLTGKKPIIQDESQDHSSLVSQFQSHNNTGKLLEILDEDIIEEGAIEHLLAVAEIARRCLSNEAEKRPSMKRLMQEFAYMEKCIPCHVLAS
ncbi:hypothetical protein H6P81_000102 [Aristolochia fimbriata]|uniref:Protein kinase domain-containing protein n=1 Tax=Aristolochia fimbriata TaxID=158543 RepID=A0AAV7F3W3_ARIFI|nr:hypothetical protein H6P81_000102 [Aristolochia fimbriata]